jgi:hypothetical protein
MFFASFIGIGLQQQKNVSTHPSTLEKGTTFSFNTRAKTESRAVSSIEE